MSDLMRIGSSALSAAYAQLQTTGQNIANAATPGYTRREVVLQEAGNMSGEGWTGRGVDAVAVRRIYDPFLVRESASSRASASQDAARSEGLERMDRLFADPQTGIGAAFDDLVAAFSELSSRPADASARGAVIARAEAFASRIANVDARLVELREGTHDRMRNDVTKANDLLAGLAGVNQRLGQVRGAQGEPNALLDERDRMLSELNGVLRANATVAQDGTVNVTSQRGEPLVVAGVASRLAVVADPSDGSRLGVSVLRGNGTSLPLDPSDVGGSLAGLMRFARDDVESVRAQVGRLAAAVAGGVNARQAVGLDAAGRAGEPLFALGVPGVSVAADNAGSARLELRVVDPSALKASDYELAFDGAEYLLTRRSDGEERRFAALPATFDGLELRSGSGTPAAGDRFVLRGAGAFATGLRAQQTDGARLATALPVTTQTGAANAGDLRASELDVQAVLPATAAPVTITFTGPGVFSVDGAGTGNPTGLPYTPGMWIEYNGWSMTLDGTPAAGDTLSVGPTQDPRGDNRNARAMAGLGDAAFVDGASVIARYAELVGDVGARAQSARATGDMSQRLHEDAERARSELSGVNLDEEAARLLQHQQAYQAAAKVIATANEMFRALLAAAG